MNDLAVIRPAKQSRIVVILHPNTERAEIVTNDVVFNRERYCFSRDKEADGYELEMIQDLEMVVGIDRAQPQKNKISLEIAPCMKPDEYIPDVIAAVRAYVYRFNPEYAPDIYLDNRRYTVDPVYSEDGWNETKGVRQGMIDVGVPGIMEWKD